MPKLWDDTIATHRHAVQDAVLDAAAALIGRTGLGGASMAAIAAAAGIGRATLYKYYPDLDAILAAWHQREVSRHLVQLRAIEAATAAARLAAVLGAYAHMLSHTRGHYDTAVAARLHRSSGVVEAESELVRLVAERIGAARSEGAVRDDVADTELAAFAVSALGAAGGMQDPPAVERLVALTVGALSSPAATEPAPGLPSNASRGARHAP
jgi:AcrR family transcriptional regulator